MNLYAYFLYFHLLPYNNNNCTNYLIIYYRGYTKFKKNNYNNKVKSSRFFFGEVQRGAEALTSNDNDVMISCAVNTKHPPT